MGAENKDLDVIIIGAGPAGISAGIWCKDLGLNAVVLEKEAEPGGQLLSIYNPITNYPGLIAGNGREMRDRFMDTALNYGVEIILSAEVIELDSEKMSVTTADGKKYSARSIILATGVRRRKLNIPGEKEFQGKGIIESGSRDKESVRGKTVAIIGGGDAALENALILADYAEKVYLVHRRDSFSAREEFKQRVFTNPAIEIIPNSQVVELYGDDSVRAVEIVDIKTKEHRIVPAQNVLFRVGVEPISDLLAEKSVLDSQNYVLVSTACHSSTRNIFAIGDVANPTAPTIVTATGAGGAVAKNLYSLLR